MVHGSRKGTDIELYRSQGVIAMGSNNPLDGLRQVSDADAWHLAALIGACWAEHSGCVFDVHGEHPELLAPASTFNPAGAAFWVLPEGSWLAACIGAVPIDDQDTELIKLYVARHRRRRGVGRALVALVEDHARLLGARTVSLWSDSRFTDGHDLYLALGYKLTGRARELHDRSQGIDLEFHKDL